MSVLCGRSPGWKPTRSSTHRHKLRPLSRMHKNRGYRYGLVRVGSNALNTGASVSMPAPDVKTPRSAASDWRGGLSQNNDQDQNQDREDQRTSTEENDFAHCIGL